MKISLHGSRWLEWRGAAELGGGSHCLGLLPSSLFMEGGSRQPLISILSLVVVSMNLSLVKCDFSLNNS